MIVIAGKNNIAVNALSYLAKSIGTKKLAVVCNFDEDGKDSWQLSLRKKAIELGIIEITLNAAEKCADIFISLEFDQIIKVRRFKTTNLFNIHFSLLPKYRGMYTSTFPILNNEMYTGVTLHKIDDGIDSGEIIVQKRTKISVTDCSLDLYIKNSLNAIEVFINSFDKISSGHFSLIKQDESISTYFSKKSINFKHNKLNFAQSTSNIFRFIRAYAFRPYQFAEFQKKKIVNAELLNSSSNLNPGSIIKQNEFYADVSTIDQDLRLFYDKFDLAIELCQKNEVSQINKILKNLVNIDDRNNELQTLLMIASGSGFFDLTKLLILNGASVNAMDFKGNSVLDYARNRTGLKNNKVIGLLKDHGKRL